MLLHRLLMFVFSQRMMMRTAIHREILGTLLRGSLLQMLIGDEAKDKPCVHFDHP